jgi:hypothetical protein
MIEVVCATAYLRPPTANTATAPQIAAQSANDSSKTKISASLLLSPKIASASDREDIEGSSPTLQKSAWQARSVAIFLSISPSTIGRRKAKLLARFSEAQPTRFSV